MTKEMTQPCLIYLMLISLGAQVQRARGELVAALKLDPTSDEAKELLRRVLAC